jgi:hypothetical protein
MAEFDLVVAKPDFKFHASHFIAHNGYRERLHGHTYKAQVTITAQNVRTNISHLYWLWMLPASSCLMIIVFAYRRISAMGIS